MNSEQVERHLRYLIVGLLHVGRLKRGDLLPSIRGVAREIGADHRAVAAAYRVLEGEGLVEIRRGSGVYLASDASAGIVQSEMDRWVSGVLLEGWNRRVARADLAALMERCAGSSMRCACVESNEDHMVAIAAELENDFSLRVQPVLVSPTADAAAIPAQALAAADLVVTTVFHGTAVRAAASGAGKPCIVLSLNPDFAAEVNRQMAGHDVTAVIVDPRYAARARAYLEVTPHRGRVQLVLVDELQGPGDERLQGEGVMVTRAARRRLGMPDYHLVPTPPPYVSPAAARALFELIVELSGGSSDPDA
ncbi:MAG TPA: GntR family transcriptional regulator [Longimicrobium sp.]|nr:GntR family transcriptional regulator [Longimicrobium sp.]